jgi:MFS family permease
MSASNITPNRFGFIGLEPGVRTRHMWVLMYAAFVSIGLATFDAFATPYVLSVGLGLPIEQQGAVIGRLNVYTEIILLIVFTPFGVLSDRIGRRAVYAFGFCCLAAGYSFFPYAETVTELALARVLYSLGLGAVTGMIATLLGDYAIPAHRGRIVGLTGVVNGLGIVCSAIFLARLPSVFVERGYDAFTAGQYTLFIISGLCIFSAIVVGFGLKSSTAIAPENRLPVKALFRSGIAAATENPRIAVAYASAFVARGDLVVVGSFLVLWGKLSAVNSGMDTAAALEAGRLPFVIAQSAALIWAIAAIFLIDKVHRMTALAACMGLAAFGYTMLILVDDPLDTANIPFFLLLGVGQISAFLGSTTLIGKEAPAANRGSVVGVFSVAGALGILITSGIGGTVFDAIDPRAPFVLLGVMNLLVMGMAIYVRVKAPGPKDSELDSTAAVVH